MSTFIFDLDGTLYHDDEAIPGATRTVAVLRSRGHRVLFASNNAGHSRADCLAKLHCLGIGVEPDGLVTAAHATALYLSRLPDPPRSLLVLGPPALRHELAAEGFDALRDGQPPYDTVVVGPDHAFTYERLRTAQAALLAGARLVATDGDHQIPHGDGLIPGTATLTAALELAAGVSATTIGKPEPALCRALMTATGADPARTIIVGDSLVTDIAIAAALGLYGVLVRTGIQAVHRENSSLTPDLTVPSVAELISALERHRPELVAQASSQRTDVVQRVEERDGGVIR